MKLNNMRLDIAMGEIFEIHDALQRMVNLLSLTDQMHAALHEEPPHKSPLTLKVEAARDIASEWIKRAQEQHQRELG